MLLKLWVIMILNLALILVLAMVSNLAITLISSTSFFLGYLFLNYNLDESFCLKILVNFRLTFMSPGLIIRT